jgi:N-acetylneuraminic acid mutarotase
VRWLQRQRRQRPVVVADSHSAADAGPRPQRHPVGADGGETTILDPGANQVYESNALPVGLENGTLVGLQDGRVLYAGGDIDGVATAHAWIFDSNVQVWTRTNNMNVARTLHIATLLNNGMVLIAGGASSTGSAPAFDSAETFDPSTNQFALTGSLITGRAGPTATLLADNDVLVAGGETRNAAPTYLASAEVWSPTTGA